ncbi:Na/Pi cotransporter family protein [Falsiporphyromonas endometrii]|uniref:Na/Pi cotransporter family protein n=1 Tax=Falsiporphyromonas endometrii TaxID=1387297 RepID=A0ABV9K4L8_9PORP
MEYSFLDLLTLVGSLGVFLYGMKIMSEGLQKIAGERMRTILSVMTSNRFLGVFTGILITALIQSSSATTLMVVSFVNAGLLSLAQSISVIMGANVGTTVTAWIISLFGFKVDIGTFALPLVAFCIPLLFSKKSTWKNWGEFIMGFSLLFLGLGFLKDSMPDLQSNPQILAFLQDYTNMGYGSVFLFLMIGTIMTIVVQSSSATVAITLIMCSKGWIPFEMATAMVLGENIGTTITANLAALGANTNAKRAALAHLLFNIFGVIWVLILFYPFNSMIVHISEYFGQGDPNALFKEVGRLSQHYDADTMSKIVSGALNSQPQFAAINAQLTSLSVVVSMGLALFHTMFNICNVLVMIWFVKFYVMICNKLIPAKKGSKDEDPHLQFVSFGMLSTSELNLLQVRQEVRTYGVRVARMLSMDEQLLVEKNKEQFTSVFNRIEKYENICDRMEVEIAKYLNKLSEGRLSSEAKEEVRVYLRVISEIESIGDACFNIARGIRRRNEGKSVFSKELNDQIKAMFALCYRAIDRMNEVLELNEFSTEDARISYDIENEINNLRDRLKLKNMEDMQNKLYEYQDAVYYMDIVDECEKFGDYVLNVVQALVEKKI